MIGRGLNDAETLLPRVSELTPLSRFGKGLQAPDANEQPRVRVDQFTARMVRDRDTEIKLDPQI
ncbi:hypothetical protein MCEMSEM23_00960 [Rhabdaerophilaceae bacterium]